MPGDKIGVKVSEEYVLDGEAVFRGKSDVVIRVALRVNDGCRAGRFVPDHIGRVRQTRQVELLEDHRVIAPFAEC